MSCTAFAPVLLRRLADQPPAAIVIDLSRLPLAGRDVGVVLRRAKRTRHIPLVFAGGTPDKVERVRALLPDASFTARDARVIVLDLSNSMLAQDLKPDRLTQARYRLADLLRGTTEGQTGMVAFAGDAFVVSPLTSDMNTISNLLPALRPDIIPVAGSRANLALEMAAKIGPGNINQRVAVISKKIIV